MWRKRNAAQFNFSNYSVVFNISNKHLWIFSLWFGGYVIYSPQKEQRNPSVCKNSNHYGLPMHFIKFALNWMQAAQEGLECEKCTVLPIKSKLFVTSGKDSNNNSNNNNNTWRTIALVVAGLFVAVCVAGLFVAGFCFYKKVISIPSQTSPPEQNISDENEALCEANGNKEENCLNIRMSATH